MIEDTKRLCADMSNVAAVILAGGKGTRLRPLTEKQPKPGVQFAAKLRIIDFAFFNAVNSHINDIFILTQYGHYPIQRHMEGLINTDAVQGKHVYVLPPQHMGGHGEYLHTANAVHQNAPMFNEMNDIEYLLILSGDHIYKQDYRVMYDKHCKIGAHFTIAGLWVNLEDAQYFGIMELDDDGNVIRFVEKPKNPKPSPNGKCFASMGIYLANKDFLLEELQMDHKSETSSHDFGGDLIPSMIYNEDVKVIAYDFQSHTIAGEDKPYWRDVGRLGQLLEANMDLVNPTPELNLYNHKWPIISRADNMPGAKWVQLKDVESSRPDWVYKPLGCITAGGSVFDWPSNLDRVVIHRNVRIGRFSELKDSVLYDDVKIGKNVKLLRVIVMCGAIIHDETSIGFDVKADHARGVYIDEDERVVVVPENTEIWPSDES